MTDKITIEISRDLLFEACVLVYSSWTKEYDALKSANAETDDGSEDWQLFHNYRVSSQIAIEAKWRKRVDEARPLSTLAISPVNPTQGSK